MTEAEDLVERAAQIVAASERTLAFTGAGVSTESGIPDFRGPNGLWKRVDPKLFTIDNYVSDPEVRRRSWQVRIEQSAWAHEPNPSHYALAGLARAGVAPVVVTQNIDGLHQAAGSDDVIEVHGTTREVACLSCGDRSPVEATIERVHAGDEDPVCMACGGILKTATISFGQALEPEVLDRAFAEAAAADVCLAAGSTLSVTPAAYVPQEVVSGGGRLVIVNEEPTELDALATLRIPGRTGTVLPAIERRVGELRGVEAP